MSRTLTSLALLALFTPLVTACHPDDGGEDVMAGDSETVNADTSATETGDPLEEVCDVESPYQGGWSIGCCQDEILPQNGWSPGGVFVGTIMPDYYFGDQFGEEVRLYDFCHNAIYFEYAAVW